MVNGYTLPSSIMAKTEGGAVSGKKKKGKRKRI